MASPYQQRVFQRKLLYIALILVLFSATWAWRNYVLAGQASRLAIREESRGEVELSGAAARLGLVGSRGLVTCYLWSTAQEKQKKNQWNELEVTVRWLTKLQPHFITPWLFQSWNLAYNVSVESDRVRDKYFYVTRGIELLAEGERQNRNNPEIRWSLGFYTENKICKSDETNVQRSLAQLSMIPPNQRDPARFWKAGQKGPVFNYAEFAAFCRENPQLVRRLRNGIHRDNEREKLAQFTCPRPQDVVQFLEDNQQIPGLYAFTPPTSGQSAVARVSAGAEWDRNKKDEFLPVSGRFPPLPPTHAGAFDAQALTADSPLGDDVDGHAIAHSWYCFAQEPIPPCGDMPGSTQPITDPARERKPKSMTTLIFRNHPSLALRYMATRLQEEGWYDEEGWAIGDGSDDEGWNIARYLKNLSNPTEAEREGRLGAGRKWSLDAWKRAKASWEAHGEKNKVWFRDPAAVDNQRTLAERFWHRYMFSERTGLLPQELARIQQALHNNPPNLREDKMSPAEKEEYQAARFMFEYNFYRRLSNFNHQFQRAVVEAQEATVATRKLLYEAEILSLAGSPTKALRVYETPVKLAAWDNQSLTPLEAWRKLVLLPNKEFRRDGFAQEATAEYYLRYMRLWNRHEGKLLKEKLAEAAKVLPLAPHSRPDLFRGPVLDGPLAGADDEGVPFIGPETMELVMERMHIRARPVQKGPTPPRKPLRPSFGTPGDK
jgi:hypothetical protein